MKHLLYTIALVISLLGTSYAAPKTPLKKHALARVALAGPRAVKFAAGHALTGFAKTGATVLFGFETGVDGVHLALFTADKAFDILSLQGKFPVLDVIYSAVSVANTDTGRLDVGVEGLESRLWGYHN